jgi:hypothetical protein
MCNTALMQPKRYNKLGLAFQERVCLLHNRSELSLALCVSVVLKAFCWALATFYFVILYTVSKTPWTEASTYTQNERTQKFMP